MSLLQATTSAQSHKYVKMHLMKNSNLQSHFPPAFLFVHHISLCIVMLFYLFYVLFLLVCFWFFMPFNITRVGGKE